MTYEQALEEVRIKGTAHCGDQAYMAQFVAANIQTLIGAVTPQLIWEGAQKLGLTTRQLVDLCATDKLAAAELMWA
jgi:hypothetical protein